MDSHKKTVITAISLFAVIGAAGMAIYHVLVKKKPMLHTNVERREMLQMRREIEELKIKIEELRSKSKKSCRRRRMPSENVEVRSVLSDETDYRSARGSDVENDDDDDEFFDTENDISECYDQYDAASSEPNKDLAELFEGVDKDVKNADSLRKHYQLLKDIFVKHRKHFGVLWRLMRACSYMCEIDTERKSQYIEEGCRYGKYALDDADGQNNANVHKWYAIVVGKRAELKTKPTEKIEDGNAFKQHLDMALNLQPNDHTLYYLLGRYKFELAGLSWYEKTIANSFFGKIDSCSYEEALEEFMCSETLSPDTLKENQFMIAKCHHMLGNTSDASNWLKRALRLPSTLLEDQALEQEIKLLFDKYGSKED